MAQPNKLSRKEIVLRGFVKEVCIDGRPFEIVNDSGMQDISGGISVSIEALKKQSILIMKWAGGK